MSALESAIRWLERFNNVMLLLCRYAIILIVAILATVLISAVVWRYGLNSAISWSEEACKYLMVWLTFLGAPISLRHFGHINIDLLIKVVPRRVQQILHLFISIVIVITMGVVFIKGISFTQMGMRQVASSFNLSMFYVYVAVPIGSALLCLVAIEHVLRSLVGIQDPARGLHIPDNEADIAPPAARSL